MGSRPRDLEAIPDPTSDQEVLVYRDSDGEPTSHEKSMLLVPLTLCRKEGWKLLFAAALFVGLVCATLLSVKATHIISASVGTRAVGLHAHPSRAATVRVADAASTGGTRSFAQLHVAPVKEASAPDSSKRPIQWTVEPTHKWIGMMEKFKVIHLPNGSATIQTMYGLALTPQHDGTVTADGFAEPDGKYTPSFISGAGAWVIDKKGKGVNLRSSAYGKCAAWDEGTGFLHLAGCNLATATFTLERSKWGDSLRTAFGLKNGWYLGLRPSLLQDHQMLLRAVQPSTVSEVSRCLRFHERQGEKADTFSLQTWRGTYVSFNEDGSIELNADKIGEREQLKRLHGRKHGAVSFATSSGAIVRAWKNGEVNSSKTMEAAEKDFSMVSNDDGTVSIHTLSGTAFCAIEQVINIITCETRRSGAPTFVMQGIQPGVRAINVGAGKKWYGYRTKVDLYRNYARARAKDNIPGELMITIDAADVAWGGCTYQDLLDRYHTISRVLGGTPIVVGADNKAWPKPKTWGYGALAHLREPLMSTYGMHKDTYCNFSNCTIPPHSHYAFANSGFMMGPPKQLLFVLDCMRASGFGDYAESGFDDQAGLQECIFKHKDLIGIDYTGLLSLQLIDMNHNGVLYHKDGKVRNRAAGGMTQCFVHGNGDSLGKWWNDLFPHQQMSEKWGENFKH